MLIKLKTNQGELKVKDVLDIDCDMSVKEANGKFVVRINKNYTDTELYNTKKEAEERMLDLADMRNSLEEEFRQF